jgi:hypothetical protein
MSQSEQLESGAPLPAVSVDDMKRVWHMIDTVHRDAVEQGIEAGAGGGVGIDARLIAEQCEPGANFQAVFFRTTLLRYLYEKGLLDEWREVDSLRDSVFQVGATFPMEPGNRGFDSAAFVGRLRAL